MLAGLAGLAGLAVFAVSAVTVSAHPGHPAGPAEARPFGPGDTLHIASFLDWEGRPHPAHGYVDALFLDLLQQVAAEEGWVLSTAPRKGAFGASAADSAPGASSWLPSRASYDLFYAAPERLARDYPHLDFGAEPALPGRPLVFFRDRDPFAADGPLSGEASGATTGRTAAPASPLPANETAAASPTLAVLEGDPAADEIRARAGAKGLRLSFLEGKNPFDVLLAVEKGFADGALLERFQGDRLAEERGFRVSTWVPPAPCLGFAADAGGRSALEALERHLSRLSALEARASAGNEPAFDPRSGAGIFSSGAGPFAGGGLFAWGWIGAGGLLAGFGTLGGWGLRQRRLLQCQALEAGRRNEALARERESRIGAQNALRESEERSRETADHLPIAVCEVDPSLRVVYLNRACRRMLGFAEGGKVALFSLLDHFAEAERARARLYFRDIMRTREGAEAEFRLLRPGGAEVHVLLKSAAMVRNDRYLGIRIGIDDRTERKKAEEALRESEERHRQMFQRNQAIKLLVEADSLAIVDANSAACSFYGHPLLELRRKNIGDLEVREIEGEEALSGAEGSRGRLPPLVPGQGRRLRHRLADGAVREVEVHASPVEAGCRSLLYFIVHDITDRMKAEKELRQRMLAENLLANISGHFLNLPEAGFDRGLSESLASLAHFAGAETAFLVRFDAESGRPSKVFTGGNLTGTDGDRLGAGVLQLEWLPARWAVGREAFSEAGRERNCVLVEDAEALPPDLVGIGPDLKKLGLRSLAAVPLHARERRIGFLAVGGAKGGRLWPFETVTPLKIAAEIFSSALQKREMEERLRLDATHDALTGLANRTSFIGRLRDLIAARRRGGGGEFALLFLDLDRFKVVNDSLGHLAGDRLLEQLAQRLRACVPGDSLVARLGGDEFCILLEGSGEEAAVAVAGAIRSRLKDPFLVEGREIFNTASIGIALFREGYTEPEELLRDADTAMYRAKAEGRDRHQLFTREMHARAVQALHLETDMRKGLERGDFLLHYQPILHLDNQSLEGFEALIRWKHPELGMVPPLDFIPLAEENGLIRSLGAWVLDEACRQLKEWECLYPQWAGRLTMSVNVSGKQLESAEIFTTVVETLSFHGLKPAQLKIEITESALMEKPEQAAQILEKLSQAGFKLAMDDFGTGHSSLSYLHRFPFHVLKVDRSFVSRMEKGSKHEEIVRIILALADNLGMTVVAEGVETVEQWEHLREMDCAYGQGYLFSKPLSVSQAEEFLGRPEAAVADWTSVKPGVTVRT